MKYKNKPKFDKRKCATCIYHTEQFQGYTVIKNNKHVSISCNYASITGTTCLTKGENNSVVDKRGNDYNNCMLYHEGRKIVPEKQPLSFK